MGDIKEDSRINGESILEDDERESGDDKTDREHDLKGLFEAIFFLSNEPIPIIFFAKNFMIDQTQVKIIIDSLVDEYEERDGGIRLTELANGYQFVTNARFAEQLRHILGLRRRESLSKGMLETLAIIAYKQPLITAEIDELRGVPSYRMVVNLMKRNLVKPVGRKDILGKPFVYGTTDEFLRYFGINKLSDLPKLSEIKEFFPESE